MRSPAKAILIVERDDPTRELYERALSRDYRVIACMDDRDVLDLLRRECVCAVVLEPGQSDGRGWVLLAAMKHASDTQRIPVILCSTLDERKRGLELGASAYLIKPVLPTTLLEAVRHIIDQPR